MIRKTMIRLFSSVLVVFAMLVLCSCGKTEQEPGVYDEKKCFEYNLYFLEMNEEGRFVVIDILCRTRQDGYAMSGTYYLYDSELVLVSNQGDVKLVFTADGDNWVYHQKESEGTDLLQVKMEDRTEWKPCEVFYYFK